MPSFLLAFVLPAAGQADPLGGAAPALNAQLFRPALDSSTTWWTTTTATPTGGFAPAGQVVMHYADQPFVYRRSDGVTTDVVGGVAQADLIGWIGGDRWRLGGDAPVYLFSRSDVELGQAGLGDLALEGKGVLLRDPLAVDVAVTGRVELPTATVGGALGARVPTWELAAVLDRKVGSVLLAGNVGVRGGPRTELENVTLDDALVLRGAAAWSVTEDAGVSLEAAAFPSLSAELVNPAAVPAEWMVGGWFPFAGRTSGHLGFGTGLTPGVGAPDWRLALGVSVGPQEFLEDYDGDGISDRDDPCMTEAEDVDGVHDEDGCPDRPPLFTALVVSDRGQRLDDAAVTLTDAAGAVRPLALGEPLPLEPGAWTVAASADGHEPGSVAFEVGAEAEGTVTVLVRLAPVKVATLRVTVLGPDGAPLAGGRIGARGAELGDAPGWEGPLAPGPATVRARVPGYRPAEATVELVADETSEVVLRLVPAKAELSGGRIELRESVFFDSGKATIQAQSFPLLEEVVQVLTDHPQIARLRVEGHTDSRGAAAANLELSKRRAAAVRDWLVAHGVAAERLVSEGYGETKPVDPREVAAAWEKNRRVDLMVESWVDPAPAPTP